jgi:hypothetical protein
MIVISMHFDFCFDLIQFHLIEIDFFQSILIHFDSDFKIAKTFQLRAGHFDCFITSE